MNIIIHGTVDNAEDCLVGKTALLRNHDDPDKIWAQFDDLELKYNGVLLAMGWHEFHRDAFVVDGESAFTPGPWNAYIDDDNSFEILRAGVVVASAGPSTRVLRNHANALLIAAAPYLLAVVEGMVRMIEAEDIHECELWRFASSARIALDMARGDL